VFSPLVSVYGVRQGASIPHIKFWDILFISKTNKGKKLKFGILVGIYAYLQILKKCSKNAFGTTSIRPPVYMYAVH